MSISEGEQGEALKAFYGQAVRIAQEWDKGVRPPDGEVEHLAFLLRQFQSKTIIDV